MYFCYFSAENNFIKKKEKKIEEANLIPLWQIYRRAGIRGCYTGLGPTIARAFPANAAAIVTWELARKFLGVERE